MISNANNSPVQTNQLYPGTHVDEIVLTSNPVMKEIISTEYLQLMKL